MKIFLKNTLCIFMVLSLLFLTACCFNTGELGSSLNNLKSFETISDMRGFYSANKFKIRGGFLCLDLYGDDNLSISGYNWEPTHTFAYDSVVNNKYVNPHFTSKYRIYSYELGTDTDINLDIPYHSITACFISTVYINPFGALKYEFDAVDEAPWDFVVKIYSGEKHVAEMYYSTKLNVDRAWIENFLSEHIVKVFL